MSGKEANDDIRRHGGELAVYGAVSPCRPDPTIHGIHGRDHEGAPHLSVNFPSRPPSPLARSPGGGVLREACPQFA